MMAIKELKRKKRGRMYKDEGYPEPYVVERFVIDRYRAKTGKPVYLDSVRVVGTYKTYKKAYRAYVDI